jgi:tRNA-2-methylthio-N6-dimethylallyladenosine synthase
VKAARLSALQERLDAQAHAFNAAAVGRTLAVLLERAGRHPGQLTGRSPYLQAVHVAADEAAIGEVIEVAITAQHPHSLSGSPIGGLPSTPRARQGQACV